MMRLARLTSSRPRHGGLWVLLLVAGTAGAASPVCAQISIPSITAPKQAALRAAAAANAHTAAMQNPDPQGTPAPQPAPAAAAPAAHHPAAPIAAASAAPSPAAAGSSAKPVMSVASRPAATPKTAPATTAAAAVPPKSTPAAPAATPTNGASPAAKPDAPAKSGPAAAPPAVASGDSSATISVTQHGARSEVSLNREVYSYDPGARRDPFISLMRTGDLRPMLSDLKLVTVLYDATGRNSIAVMRDQSTKDQYRVRVGMTLGRMRVQQIQPKQVVFTIEEVGFSRQEALALGDSSKARTP